MLLDVQIGTVADQLPHHLIDGEIEPLAFLPQFGIVMLAAGAGDREVAALGKGLEEILAIGEAHRAGVVHGVVPRLFYTALDL